MDEIKEKIKNWIKKSLKAIFKSKVFIFILIFCIIAFVLCPLFIYFIKIDDAEFKENDKKSTSYVVKNNTKSAKLTTSGIQTVSSAEQLWDDMTEAGSRVNNYLDSYEELEKLMNAELITQYPKIGNGGLDGIVEFQRTKSDGTKKKLTYIDKNTFETYKDNYTSSGDTKVLDYFSLDDDGNVLVAILNKTTETLETNDSEINISDYTATNLEKIEDGKYRNVKYEISTSTIDYKSVVQKYTMPFQYLWSLLVMTQDKEFVLGLADLVAKSEITIGIYDNTTTNVNDNTYTYKKEIKTTTYAELNVKKDYGVKGYNKERYWVDRDSPNYDGVHKAEANKEDTEYKVENKIERQTSKIVTVLEKANTWIVDYSRTASNQISSPVTSQPNESNLEDTSYEERSDSPKDSNQDNTLLNQDNVDKFRAEVDKYIRDKKPNANIILNSSILNNVKTDNVKVSYVKCQYFMHLVDRKKSTTTISSSSKIVLGTSSLSRKDDINSKTDNFVTLFRESSTARSYILDAPDWLFEMLKSNDDTADMVDLTKYLLNKATDSDRFGDIDPDDLFKIFDTTNFTNMGSSSGRNVSIKGCKITRDEFISAVKNYRNDTDYQTYLAANAENFYDICTAGNNDINPCLVFAHAALETGWGTSSDCKNDNNFFGMGHGNTQASGKGYSSAAESIQDYCDWINNKISNPSSIVQDYATVDSKFSDASSIYAVYAAYAYLGDTHISDEPDFNNPNQSYYESHGSNWGTGGRIYLPLIYGDNYAKECGHPNGSDETTTKERADYSVYTTNKRVSIAEEIFGTSCLIRTAGSGDSSSILNVADSIHSYMEENSYSYCTLGAEDNSHEGECGLDATFEDSKTNHHLTCCATYVSWVLQDAGAIEDSEHTNSSSALATLLGSKGWTKIETYDELEAGDIVFMTCNTTDTIEHTQIYAGNNDWYNAGTAAASQNSAPANQGEYARQHFLYAYRVSK